MKLGKLLKKIESFLAADQDTQAAERKAIRTRLKQLKEKERELRARLKQSTDNEERTQLSTRLDVVYAQRKKGVERVKALKKK